MSAKVSLRGHNPTSKKSDHHRGQRKAVTCTGSCDFWAIRYAKNVCRKVAALAVRVTSTTTAQPKLSRHNNNNRETMGAKTSVAAEAIDSQRAEAIHDCIDFINSSSSLPRSNSAVAR
ncbi:hypothetical protein CASFOL_039603 [Castilleja foliolosa]|uniref:Josephin-like protein n=1 Tax=Castilleja foliolosa TaxID=1961234 RepID=A0ABD3BFP4_9LAMI